MPKNCRNKKKAGTLITQSHEGKHRVGKFPNNAEIMRKVLAKIVSKNAEIMMVKTHVGFPHKLAHFTHKNEEMMKVKMHASYPHRMSMFYT
jgi:hypothetical protein